MTAVRALPSSVGSASNHRNPYEVVVGASIVRPVWRNRATSLNGDHGRIAAISDSVTSFFLERCKFSAPDRMKLGTRMLSFLRFPCGSAFARGPGPADDIKARR
jgi:hypothetical protein